MASKPKLFVATPVHSEVSIHYFKACLEFQKECLTRKIPVMFQIMKSSLVTQELLPKGCFLIIEMILFE